MAKCLITGAAGLIGSHLFDWLTPRHTVVGVDNYSLGTYRNPKIYQLELLDQGATSNFIDNFQPDILVHMAAWAHEGLSQFAPIKITQNNYMTFLNTLIPAIRNGVKRVVLASSMAVYGNQPAPLDEAMARKPVDIYGINKTAMEETLEILAQVHHFEYTIIRPHNVYGPRQNMADPYRNVVAIFMNRLLQDKSFFIYGDGEQHRAFSYISDIVPAIGAAVESPSVNGQIINVGPTESYSINHLANTLLKISGKRNIVPQYLADRPQEVKEAFCTNDKAIELLGYETKTSLETGLYKMWVWASKEGPQTPVYLDSLELEGESVPETWRQRLI